MAGDAQRLAAAIRRYGPLVDPIAARYTNPVTGQRLSGDALLAKLIKGESGGRADAVSSAGARKWAQFEPGTRASFIKAFGIDPWRSPEEAVHAAELHLRGALGHPQGLEGYNPGGGQGYVSYILGQRVGSVGGGSSSAPASGGGGSAPAAVEPGGTGLADLLTALQQPKPVIQTAALQDPSFSARRNMALPASYQDVASSGAPAPRQGLADLIGQVSQLRGSDPSPVSAGGGAQATGAVSRAGKVAVAAGANRPGVGLTPGILKVVRAIAGQAGRTLTIGTGTNHSRISASGLVSDHWTGNAADIPASGQQLLQLGRQALIAAGMDPKQAARAKGGLYNIPYGRGRRIQIIFSTPGYGGHEDHLHVGITPLGG